MNQFFKNTKAKVLLAIFVVLLGFMLQSVSQGNLSTISSKLIGTITAPFSRVFSDLSGMVKSTLDRFQKVEYLLEENRELKEKNAELTKQTVALDKYKNENENFKKMMDIQQKNQNLDMVSARVIGKDISERFYSFMIDKGTNQGVSKKNAVITNEGLVGIVTEVSEEFCVVSTILDPKISVGSYATGSLDTGIVTGDIGLVKAKKSKLTYVSRVHQIASGSLIATSGTSNIFPKDLVIGKVDEMYLEEDGISMSGTITPAVDIESVKQVQIITKFS